MENLVNPIKIKTHVSSFFGHRPDPIKKNITQFHNGIDLSMQIGTEIFSPVEGKAFHIINDMGGYQLIILASNGMRFGFAHLNNYAVKHNEAVKAGQLIAYSGNSGKHTTGAHLHFTVTDVKGQKVNPLLFFKF